MAAIVEGAVRHGTSMAAGPSGHDGAPLGGVSLTSHLVVIDLSALYATPALGLMVTCATAWLQATPRHDDGIRRLAILSNQAIG